MESTQPRDLSSLEHEEFLVLTTYRASGEGVPTTVWFAAEGGRLYIVTMAAAGKARRIRAQARVTLAASDRVGNVHGPTIEATARITLPTSEEGAIALRALQRKYGEQFTRSGPSDLTTRVFLVVSPAERAI